MRIRYLILRSDLTLLNKPLCESLVALLIRTQRLGGTEYDVILCFSVAQCSI